jgi:CheY-like chemotaxis protein
MSNEKKLILIADDDADYLFQMEAMVKNLGFRVKTAESQAEAEKVLETTQPDLAIFDLMMEQEDSGFILSYKAKRKRDTISIYTTKTIATGSKPTFISKKEYAPISFTAKSINC